jgi:hypothetical protein
MVKDIFILVQGTDWPVGQASRAGASGVMGATPALQSKPLIRLPISDLRVSNFFYF